MPEGERERERGGIWLQFPFVSLKYIHMAMRNFSKCSSKKSRVLKKDYCVKPVGGWRTFSRRKVTKDRDQGLK